MVTGKILASSAALICLGGTAGAQIDAGYLGPLGDQRTTSSYSSATRRTERTLTLVPTAPRGGPAVSLVLTASFEGRTRSAETPVVFSLRTHYGLHSDDRVRGAEARVESHRLIFDIDPRTRDGIRLAFFPTSWGYGGFVPPGGEIPVAFFSLTEADVRALALARAIEGSVLWTDFTLSAQELDALKRFASDLLPLPRPRS